MYNTTSTQLHFVVWLWFCGFVVTARAAPKFVDIVVRLWLWKYISKAITMVIRNPEGRGGEGKERRGREKATRAHRRAHGSFQCIRSLYSTYSLAHRVSSFSPVSLERKKRSFHLCSVLIDGEIRLENSDCCHCRLGVHLRLRALSDEKSGRWCGRSRFRSRYCSPKHT